MLLIIFDTVILWVGQISGFLRCFPDNKKQYMGRYFYLANINTFLIITTNLRTEDCLNVKIVTPVLKNLKAEKALGVKLKG